MSTDQINPLVKIGDVHYLVTRQRTTSVSAHVTKITTVQVNRVARLYAYYIEESDLRYVLSTGSTEVKDGSDWYSYTSCVFDSMEAAVAATQRAELSRIIIKYCKDTNGVTQFSNVTFATLEQFVLELTTNIPLISYVDHSSRNSIPTQKEIP